MFVLVDDGDRRSRLVGTAGDLRLQAFDALDRVQPKIIRIRTSEADRVGASGQRLHAVFFQRLEVVLANLQHFGNGRQIVAAPKPRRAQILADRLQRCLEIAGNLTKMNAPPIKPAFFIQCQPRDLCHLQSDFAFGQTNRERQASAAAPATQIYLQDPG